MGGEGSMASAINSLRQNRALLKKRIIRSKNDVYGIKGKIKLKFKTASAYDILQIRRKMKMQRKKNKYLWFISAVIFLIIVYSISWLFFPKLIGL